jgi:ectoine hydroxylase-related dioxygenase (phytanoyl-CoA dioxygenase family)
MQNLNALTPEQLGCLPTETDIAFYEEHGWYISPPILSDEVIDQAIFGTQRYYRGERDHRLPVQKGFSDWKLEDGDGIRNNEFVSLQNTEIRALVMQPIIGAIAAKLARTPQVRLLDDQLVYKPPLDQSSESAVGWHCDRAYWSTCTSDRLLTAWIPFQDCHQASGPLVVMDRSHQWRGQENLRAFNHKNLDTYSDQFRREGRQVEIVPMLLKKGQVSFHHCWTVHGSYPNVSHNPRLALAVHLQDGDNQYHAFRTPQGQDVHMFDEQLCQKLPNGDPDFSDPQIFPVLWQERISE